MSSIHLVDSIAAVVLAAALLGPHASGARADAAPPVESLGPNIVANGGFEQGADPGEHIYLPAGASPLLPGWTLLAGAVLYGTSWQAEEGNRSLALHTDGGLGQALKTKVGQKYRVVFYQAGNPNDHAPSTIRAQIGAYQHDYTYQSGQSATTKQMDWLKRTFTYTAIAATTPLSFTVQYDSGNDPFGLDNIQVRAILSGSASGTPATSLRLGSATASAGGTEAIAVTAAPNAALVVVIDYPGGAQAVTQAKADTTGHYTLSLTLPPAVTGTVHVTVDSGGSVAQTTFTVS